MSKRKKVRAVLRKIAKPLGKAVLDVAEEIAIRAATNRILRKQ